MAEDDPRDVELTLAALEEHHLANRVAVVGDGAAALDYLYYRGKFQTRAGGNPIVVLLDNKMPKVSGLEVLKTMKADEHLKTIPVVVLTSSRETPDLIEFQCRPIGNMHKTIDFIGFLKSDWRFNRHTPSHSIQSCQKVLIFCGFHAFPVG